MQLPRGCLTVDTVQGGRGRTHFFARLTDLTIVTYNVRDGAQVLLQVGTPSYV